MTVNKPEDVLEASVLQDDIFLLDFFSGVNFGLLGPSSNQPFVIPVRRDEGYGRFAGLCEFLLPEPLRT